VSVPTERDDVLPDPDYLQEGVQGLVGLLVRLGEPDIRDAERIAVVLLIAKLNPSSRNRTTSSSSNPSHDRSTCRRSRWATGCTGSASAPTIWNSGAECSQTLYWWAGFLPV
jgi:hypothetical protein